MKEFLTIKNFVPQERFTTLEKVWYGFLACICVIAMIALIAHGVKAIIRRIHKNDSGTQD